jgi:hypothetical protein
MNNRFQVQLEAKPSANFQVACEARRLKVRS